MIHRTELRDAGEIMNRASTGVTRWVLGAGLLAFHASAFAVTMIGLLLWNLYSAPTELWIDNIFRSWATLLAFHAIAVGAGWLAWRLMRAERAAMDAAQAPIAQPMLANQPVRPWQPLRTTEPAARAEDAARRAFATTATWSAMVARRTRDAVSTTTHRVSGARGGAAPHGLLLDPTQAWPERPSQTRSEDRDFIARFNPTSNAGSVSNGLNGTADHAEGTSNGNGNGHAKHGFGKEAGWTWVETAAASWSARRDPDLMSPGSAKPVERVDGTEGVAAPIDMSIASQNDDQPATG